MLTTLLATLLIGGIAQAEINASSSWDEIYADKDLVVEQSVIAYGTLFVSALEVCHNESADTIDTTKMFPIYKTVDNGKEYKKVVAGYKYYHKPRTSVKDVYTCKHLGRGGCGFEKQVVTQSLDVNFKVRKQSKINDWNYPGPVEFTKSHRIPACK